MTVIEVTGGRILDIEVSGPEDGVPFVFHHGTPGSLVQFRDMGRAVHDRGLRMVTFSRAGYGASSRQPGRTVVDVVSDVAAVLKHLEAPRCVVAGWSGGGPHALATGARLADRVVGVLVIAGIAPYGARGLNFLDGMGEQNIEEFGLTLQGEASLRGYLEDAAVELRNADTAVIIRELSSLLPAVDVAALTDEFGEDMARSFAEALRTGVDGWLDDDLAFTEPWGFELDEIAVPTFLWQGSDDLMVPFAHGQWLAAHVPGVTAHLEPAEGHLSIGVGALERMLEELVGIL